MSSNNSTITSLITSLRQQSIFLCDITLDPETRRTKIERVVEGLMEHIKTTLPDTTQERKCSLQTYCLKATEVVQLAFEQKKSLLEQFHFLSVDELQMLEQTLIVASKEAMQDGSLNDGDGEKALRLQLQIYVTNMVFAGCVLDIGDMIESCV